jgi:two-component system, sensor histidine kinase
MTDQTPDDRLERLQRRVERERTARKQAEQMLEAISLELLYANESLQSTASDLEAQVEARTRDLHDALARAEAATKAKSEFLAVMSHEIRTPLNGVLGMAELLAGSSLDESQRHWVDTIRDSGRSLLAIINDILDFSKIEAGRMELEMHDFDVRAELAQIESLFRPLAVAKSLALAVEGSVSVRPWVRGDSVRLRQIVSNLLSNAIKFTEEGEVTLRWDCHQDDDAVALQVRITDTGMGIPADRMQHLFQPFSQAESSTTRRFGGTGLGLAICARLAEAMGGVIEATSTPGSGTSMSLMLRLPAGEPPQSAPSPEASAPPAVAVGNLRILLVEDNRVNQKLALAMLRRLGVEADLVETGREAVASVTRHRYDLVFMDMQMPEMDGIEATRAIRTHADSHQPVIVALTANAFASDRARCIDAGMDGFVAKPYRLEDLRLALELAAGGERPSLPLPMQPELLL